MCEGEGEGGHAGGRTWAGRKFKCSGGGARKPFSSPSPSRGKGQGNMHGKCNEASKALVSVDAQALDVLGKSLCMGATLEPTKWMLGVMTFGTSSSSPSWGTALLTMTFRQSSAVNLLCCGSMHACHSAPALPHFSQDYDHFFVTILCRGSILHIFVTTPDNIRTKESNGLLVILPNDAFPTLFTDNALKCDPSFFVPLLNFSASSCGRLYIIFTCRCQFVI